MIIPFLEVDIFMLIDVRLTITWWATVGRVGMYLLFAKSKKKSCIDSIMKRRYPVIVSFGKWI